MVEYFTQVHPRWTDTTRRLVSTPCPECFIDIQGVRSLENTCETGVRIGLLSSHITQRDASLWGRLRLAWAILRGHYTETFFFTRSEHVNAFVTHLMEISHEVFHPTIKPE